MARKSGLASFMEGFSTGYDTVGSIGEDVAMAKVRDWEEEETTNAEGKTVWNYGGKEYDTKLTDEQKFSAQAQGIGAAKTRWGDPEDALDFKKKQADYNNSRLVAKKAQQAYEMDKPYNDAMIGYNQKVSMEYGSEGAFKDSKEAADEFINVNTRFGRGEGFTFQNNMTANEVANFTKDAKLNAAELQGMIANSATDIDDLVSWADKVNGANKGITYQIDEKTGQVSMYNTVDGKIAGPAFVTGVDMDDFKSNLVIFSTPGGMTTLLANKKQDDKDALDAKYKESQIAKNYTTASKEVQDKAYEAWMSTFGGLLRSEAYITLHKQASSQNSPELWNQLELLENDAYKSFERAMKQYQQGGLSKNRNKNYTGFSGTEVK